MGSGTIRGRFRLPRRVLSLSGSYGGSALNPLSWSEGKGQTDAGVDVGEPPRSLQNLPTNGRAKRRARAIGLDGGVTKRKESLSG